MNRLEIIDEIITYELWYIQSNLEDLKKMDHLVDKMIQRNTRIMQLEIIKNRILEMGE